MDLIFHRPDHFSVLTGEDIMFYINLVLGGDGGVLASSHFETEKFVSIKKAIDHNDHQSALKTWMSIERFISLLFQEPNPAPIKHCLSKLDLINSAELRLPLTGISDGLKHELNNYLDNK